MDLNTKESQYQSLIEFRKTGITQSFGLMTAGVWHEDPQRLVFLLSRYKFAAKMLAGQPQVIEIGCGDGFGSRIVRQHVDHLSGTDFDPIFIEDAKTIADPFWPIDFFVHDFISGPLSTKYSAAYAIDVLEHISPNSQDSFLQNICLSLSDNGVALFGMPSIESQKYASPQSIIGHVNCQTGPELKSNMEKHFRNVFLFSMNDEIVHTGYSAMAHYLFVLCVNPKYKS